MTESFVDKYRPESWSDIRGHPSAVKEIKKWSQNFSPGDKPYLLHGPQGTGKTSTAEVVAKENEWPLEEINASSARRKEDIQNIAAQIRTKPLSADYKLVLIDEADALSTSVSPLSKVLKDAPNPVIITCNEEWQVPDSVSNKCNSEEFKVTKSTKEKLVNDICDEEDIDLSNQEKGKLKTRDDMRSILNDLERFKQSNETVGWDDRDTEIGEFKAVDNILRGKKFTGEVTPPDLVQWLDENASSELEGVEALRAYQCLSEADKWLQQTNSTQNYTWWRYAGSISEQVANMRITEPYDWIQKGYPNIRRQTSRSGASSDTPEAQMYRELKSQREFSGAYNFKEFEEVALPTLDDLSKEDRMKIVLSESLSTDCLPALNLTKNDYDDWLSSDRDDISELQNKNETVEKEEERDSGGEPSIFDL